MSTWPPCGDGVSLAIELYFDGPQPRHFGADSASARPMRSGAFVGDTRQGGSCNVAEIRLNPHCNGTHTESVGHIVDQPVAVGQLARGFYKARLLTVRPQQASTLSDNYQPNLVDDDWLISRAMLQQAWAALPDARPEALIIRTLTNEQSKKQRDYSRHSAAFFSTQAMHWILERQICHLLVDLPSIDKSHDQGRLHNHHLFWQVTPGSRCLTANSRTYATITELIYVPPELADGDYWLSLQLPCWQLDAAPSRPLVWPQETPE